jgi:hypothetical protein
MHPTLYLTFLCTFNFLKISVASRRWALSTILVPTSVRFSILKQPPAPPRHRDSDLEGMWSMGNVLLDVEYEQGQIEHERNPVPVDKEEEGQEAVDGSFRYNVCIEAVAEIDRINVVTVCHSPSQYASRNSIRTSSLLSSISETRDRLLKGRRKLEERHTTPNRYT